MTDEAGFDIDSKIIPEVFLINLKVKLVTSQSPNAALCCKAATLCEMEGAEEPALEAIYGVVYLKNLKH